MSQQDQPEIQAVEKVSILGTGPAGLTAAIYAARANLKPLCVEGTVPGGQLTITTDVENYPGFPEGIMGPKMMEDFRAQAARFGTRFFQGDVQEVDLKNHPFTLKLADGREVKTQTLIIATGASAKWLGIESEKRLMGKGVSACATCDGFFFKNLDVAVVGGGDTAMEEALFLTKFAKSVTVVHRRDELRASKIMADRALKNDKIKFEWDSAIEEVLGEKEVEGIRLKNLKTGDGKDLPVQGLFIAIGHQPNSRLFNGVLEMDEVGYIKPRSPSSATNIPGVFVSGDVADNTYRQAVTAAGTGCVAAIDAERYLETLEGH